MKWSSILRTFADEGLMARFRNGDPLPPGFGVGIDERCVEYPWLLSRLPDRDGLLLDAGSALNYGLLLDRPAFRRRDVVIATLAPEKRCFWRERISYLYHDLASPLFREGCFRDIVCLSTLEHIGCDNSTYTGNAGDREDQPDKPLRVMAELRRLLEPGGGLFLTVPFGVDRHFGPFRQYGRERWARTLAAFGRASRIEEAFFRYTAQGWDAARAEDCADCSYETGSSRSLDRAVAARAVACVHLVKE